MEKVSREEKYQQMQAMLNEKQWRQYLGMEAKERGTIGQVANEAQVSRNTVKRGIRELEAGECYQPGERIRKPGGGQKRLVETDVTLLADLEQELEPKGDPMSLLQWTTKSLDHLVKALSTKGHRIGSTALAEILHAQGFSLRANKKTIEGTVHPDRDAQLTHINQTYKQFEQKDAPIISVDCKKKEPLGNFKKNGREWQAKGEETQVNVYDFLSLADSKAVPYGIYDLVHESGFVNVGIDHETAEFAVESIRRWWHTCGKKLYPNQTELLIFSFISINWRAKPLTSLEVLLELISHTTTKEGLAVTAIKDSNIYPTTGIRVSDDELASINLFRESFHGDWNYTIKPQTT